MKDYLSLVANSGQVNTPPGSYETVKELASNSFLGPESKVLEVGCSTGFVTIELARYTGAKCFGLDLHPGSIETAMKNVDSHVTGLVSFIQGDAGQLPYPDDQFSHVVIGGHLPFAPPELRRAHVTEAVRTLRPWGYLLTALYFYVSPPPQELVEEFNQKVGTQLVPENDQAYWTALFDTPRLSLEYESLYEVIPPDASRTQRYLQNLNPDSRADWEHRLRLFAQNGEYLNYFVRIYRKIPDEPGLMLQIPRGGIYQTRKISTRVR